MKRDVVKLALTGQRPPYVPWHFGFTREAKAKLQEHYGRQNPEEVFDNHFLDLGDGVGFFRDIGDDCVQDVFGVVWDRSVDKDIGQVKGHVLSEPTLKGYQFPDPLNPLFFDGIPQKLVQYGDRFRVFEIGFSLYERAWTMRGMENLMMDFYDHPDFVHELMNTIADYNVAQVEKALTYDIDCVHFGDDLGTQRGLQMGPRLWHEFIYPVLKRMYGVVHEHGKYVSIHSCGKVDELFDDLIGIGLNMFNPFQPEVMDVWSLVPRYHGRLAFHGGMSTQRTLAYGSARDVRNEARRLIELGSNGGYVFAPAHGVEGDVPLENMLAFIDVMKGQRGYEKVVSP
jgi:uroporphyrinogen decarboxylase